MQCHATVLRSEKWHQVYQHLPACLMIVARACQTRYAKVPQNIGIREAHIEYVEAQVDRGAGTAFVPWEADRRYDGVRLPPQDLRPVVKVHLGRLFWMLKESGKLITLGYRQLSQKMLGGIIVVGRVIILRDAFARLESP